MKRALSLVVSLVMILSVCLFAACGDTPEQTTTAATTTAATTTGKTETTTADSTPAESTPTDTTAPEDTTTTAEPQPDDTTSDDSTQPEDTDPIGGGTNLEGFDGYSKLPGYEDVDFGGRVFVFAMLTDDGSNGGNHKDIYSDETDAIATAIRERNDVVSRLYNCTIELNSSESPGTIVSADVTGNMHTIDIYAQQYSSAAIYTSDQAYNLYSLGIDFTNPWWDQAYVETYTFDKNGTPAMYGAMGDYNRSAFGSTYILFYNLDLYKQSKVCQQYDIYQLVRDKKWTMDIFVEMIKDVKFDANGNSSYSYADGDIMGWVRTGHATHAMHVASNMRIVDTVNGRFTFSPSTDPAAWSNVIDQAISVWNTEGAQTMSYSQIPDYFASDKALFVSEVLSTIENMKDMDVSIGLVPYPLYSDTQDAYCNYVDNHMSPYHIPISVPDPETVATFFELFACHSKYIVRTAIIDSYTVEFLGDEESGEMLDLITSNRTYDPGYLWWSAYETDIGNMISGGKNTITQWVGRKGTSLNNNFNDFITGILDNEN